MTFQMPNSRYVLPQFLEETSFGTKQIDPYGKLFEERIVFLGTQVDDTSANDIMAQLIAEHTGQTFEQITKDSDRDRWFNAMQAKEYGIVDHVIENAAQAGEHSIGEN